jgi:hypothetical protein
MAKITKLTTKQKRAAAFVTDKDLDGLRTLLHEIEDRVVKAHDDGNTFLMSYYVRIVALLSPEVDRIEKRFKRESLAAHRRALSELKEDQEKADRGQASARKKDKDDTQPPLNESEQA